jgi:uncharacterized protein GlcG (DUF336 family)
MSASPTESRRLSSIIRPARPFVTPLEGGVPIVVDGKIVGAIGASGVMSNQDAEVAMAGAAAAAAK